MGKGIVYPLTNTAKAGVQEIDLNFSEEVQKEIHQYIKDLFGEENAIKSGTQQIYQEDALKNDIFSHLEGVSEKIESEEIDINYMARNIQTMRTTGSHPKKYIGVCYRNIARKKRFICWKTLKAI